MTTCMVQMFEFLPKASQDVVAMSISQHIAGIRSRTAQHRNSTCDQDDALTKNEEHSLERSNIESTLSSGMSELVIVEDLPQARCLHTPSFTSLQPIDLQTDIEDKQQQVAVLERLERQWSELTANLGATLTHLQDCSHQVTESSTSCLESLKDSVESTCDNVDGELKAFYHLMTKCDELNTKLSVASSFREEIKTLRKSVETLEQLYKKSFLKMSETNGCDARFLFASESVSEGHPDKLCDQISDALLDAHLTQDKYACVALDAAIKNKTVMLLGEITSNAVVNHEQIVRDVVSKIGYTDMDIGFDANTCKVIKEISEQSPEIAAGVHKDKGGDDYGAGDQGQVFGYATDETPECMPLTALLSHRLVQRLDELRHNGTLPWLRPDGKSQVTIEYKREDGALVPQYVRSVTLSAQHSPEIELSELRNSLLELVIRQAIPANLLTDKTVYNINSCGKFVRGGPHADSGLTGRKIVVDTYGGWGSHGGGAFSGKDPTKTDRSAAYMARWIAKSLVASKVCRRCKVQITYAIGVAEPLSVMVDTYGTGQRANQEILDIVHKNFNMKPGAIIQQFDLRRPIYQKTSTYGHFGRDCFPWEVPKLLKY